MNLNSATFDAAHKSEVFDTSILRTRTQIARGRFFIQNTNCAETNNHTATKPSLTAIQFALRLPPMSIRIRIKT
jgi:hypothetical protein